MKYLLFLITLPLVAQISFVGAADLGNNNGASNTLTASYTVGSGANRMLAVCLMGDTGVDDVTGVTYNGVAMTKINTTANNNSSRFNYLFLLLNPSSGANNVVATASVTHYLLATAADYAGVKQTGLPDAQTVGDTNGGGGTLVTTLTTVADNSWAVLCGSGPNGVNPWTMGTNSTLRVTQSTFSLQVLVDSNGPFTPAGSHSMTIIGSGTQVASNMASFAPAGGSPPATGRLIRVGGVYR